MVRRTGVLRRRGAGPGETWPRLERGLRVLPGSGHLQHGVDTISTQHRVDTISTQHTVTPPHGTGYKYKSNDNDSAQTHFVTKLLLKIVHHIIVKLRRGSGKDWQGMALKVKGLKA